MNDFQGSLTKMDVNLGVPKTQMHLLDHRNGRWFLQIAFRDWTASQSCIHYILY